MDPQMWSAINGTVRDLFNVLLPPCCPLCKEETGDIPAAFCPTCAAGIRPITSPCCPCCALPYPGEIIHDHLCEECLRKKPSYERVLAGAHYDGSLREAIHRFKYRGDIGLESALARTVGESFARDILDFSPDLMIPVPLHVGRLRERTYNQAQLLALRLGKMLTIPVDSRLLQRTRATDSQQRLSGRARRANLRGAFEGADELAQRRILLIDDVMTTGATVEECSREMMRCGAESVLVAVLARSAGQTTVS
ncbi:MAG: ComF family protein [Desulfuromonadales bacterium]